MLGYVPVFIVQCIGVGIPILGIIVLMRKGQGKENTFLVMANFGALMMNWGYLQMLQGSDYQTIVSVYKFEYIGSVLFYLFFVFFVRSFLKIEEKSKKILIGLILFMMIEVTSLGGVLLDSPYCYGAVEVQFRKDDGKLFTNTPNSSGGENRALEIIANPNTEISQSAEIKEDTLLEIPLDETEAVADLGRGYASISITPGVLLRVRYACLSFVLIFTLIQTMFIVKKRKVVEERKRFLYLAMAELVVFASLLVNLFVNTVFDVSPVLVSCSVMAIICGTASGNFFSIADRGRGWVLDHSDVIFVILDKEYHFLDANDYAKKIFPLLMQLPIHSVIPEDFKRQIMNENSEVEWNEKRYAKRMAPIEAKGKVIGYSILFIDMTEHYDLMEKLELETQKAISANEAKSNFMSNMSHEIRTPMNAIVGMTEIMLRREQDQVNTEYLTNIKNSGNALLAVVNDILDFSKIESGKLEIIPEEYEIMSVLNDLSMIFLNRIGEKPLELIYDIDPNLPVKLYGDSGRIRQVLLNIVNNGIKYTDEGYVKLSMEVEWLSNEEILLHCAVWDSGIGIKKEDIPKLFSTFSQVDTKRNRGKEGTGLGLSIAKQLVEAMEGEFSVESEYGVGSVFRFTMKQKVIDKNPAAIIKTTKDIYVAGLLKNEKNLENLKKICASYERTHFVELLGEKEITQLNYLFVDRPISEIIKEETLSERMECFKPEIITLYNPMILSGEQNGTTLMNKPLYTLNFCLAMNHEVMSFQQKQEKIMTFTAPEAHVLIVDDNEMNRKVAAGLLEPLNMQIDFASDGKKAVEKIMKNHYDIVFMDHMMPVMDGIEATAAIRALNEDTYKTLPIIALSANALQEAKKQFIEVGMNDFLAKPIKTKELIRLVEKYLPVELIVESGEITSSGVDSDFGNTSQMEELPSIEGLDVMAGIENSGGRKLFLSLLGDFYKLIDRKATKIEKCLQDEMIRDYTIEVHALKNTARMIGALELSEQFYELEKAGNREDLDYIKANTPKTLELFCSYKSILEPFAVSDNESKEKLSLAEMKETIESLREAMDSFDLDKSDACMKKLESAQIPENLRIQVENLGALVADVAMEEVISLCDELLVEMS